MGVFTKLTLHKKAGDEVFVPDAGGCNELLYRVGLTLGMHNGAETGKPDDDPTKDVWTIETE